MHVEHVQTLYSKTMHNWAKYSNNIVQRVSGQQLEPRAMQLPMVLWRSSPYIQPCILWCFCTSYVLGIIISVEALFCVLVQQHTHTRARLYVYSACKQCCRFTVSTDAKFSRCSTIVTSSSLCRCKHRPQYRDKKIVQFDCCCCCCLFLLFINCVKILYWNSTHISIRT